MIHATLLEEKGVLIIKPKASLSKDDFQQVAAIVDPHIESHGKLNGILIQAEAFPGWAEFGAFLSHMKFIRGHHRQVSRIATVSDSRFLKVAPRIASQFVNAELRHFPANQFDTAMDWLEEKD